MSEKEKEGGAAVKFPPPFMPLLTIVVGHLLGRFVPIFDQFDLATPGRYWVGGLIAVAAVAIFIAWPFAQFKRSKQDPAPWTPTPEIVVEGPYKFTRNPMYVGLILFCFGIGIVLSDIWTLILTPVCAWMIYLIAIRQEEVYLQEKFGDSYRAYKKRVRRWI